ncbi:MAG: FlgD immunoglobulin-like domain containing protein [Candidatus Zixiibacteriota bacterium]
MKSKVWIILGVVVVSCLVALITVVAKDNRIVEINGDSFDLSNSNPELVYTNPSAGTAEVNITGIDASGFPVIEVYADVLDSFGILRCGLEEEDFCLYQDGVPVEFEVASVDTFDCPTSICLVIDKSGSMAQGGYPMDDAKEAAKAFVRRKGPDDRIAVVAYSTCVDTVSGFTSDTLMLITRINSMTPSGRTALFDGFWLGTDLTCAESNVAAVIGFSDGGENESQSCWPPPDGRYDPEGYFDDCNLVSSYAVSCGFPIHTIGLGRDVWPEPLICLAENTGGRYYYAPSAEELDSIYAQIQSELCCRYVFTYTSPDTIVDCTNHQVVVCEGGVDCTPCDTGYYQELCPPVITRTPPTIELSDTCQFHSQDLVIEAWVVDGGAPFVQQVLLFWRETGSGDPYMQVTMTHQGGDLYRGIIPGAALPMGTPGADYYLTATDGELSVSDPPENPQTSPHQIDICPNEPPIITDVWFVADTCVLEDEPFPIMCEVLDTTDWVDSVQLFYRPTGGGAFDMVLMSDQGGDEYLGTVPGSAVGSSGIDYYIRAVDNYGLEAFYGSSVAPHHVPICPNEPPVIVNVWYLEDTCAVEEEPFPIKCEVFDTTDYVDSVQLFYRDLGETGYDMLTMSDQGGGEYQGTVPGSVVGTDGFEYYIRAVDNRGLESFHADSVTPYVVPICPNEPPVITAVWYPDTNCVWQGNLFPIMCTVLDTTDFVDSVFLFYRRGGEISYEDTVMEDQGGDEYLGVVPGSFTGPTGIDYYIRAVDNFGLEGFYASAANPVHVDTCPHELQPPVQVPFDTCVYQGRITCIPVLIDSLPPYDIFVVHMVMFYDDTVIQATHATTENSIAESWGPPTYAIGPDSIYIRMSGTPALGDTGVLVWVCFEATGEIGDTTMLEFKDDSIHFNRIPYPARKGIIRVCEWGVTVDFDIKPTSCPNPLNVKAGGVLPTAILSTDEFDVSDIDPETVLLEGVAPLRWEFEDVTAPVDPREDTCDCTTEGPDEFMDMTFKFSKQEIVAALEAQEPLEDGQIRVLTITGMTYDGQPIQGQDCVWIRKKGPAAAPPVSGFCLRENYPNPFNPETDISFTLPIRTHASLTIYNIEGKKVRTLASREMDVGTHTVHWNGRDEAGNPVASGIYFYRLKTRDFDQTQKMVLMK